MGLFGQKEDEETLEGLQEQEEKLRVKARNADLQLTIAQKRLMHQKLKEQGLKESDFSFNWNSIRAWLKARGL